MFNFQRDPDKQCGTDELGSFEFESGVQDRPGEREPDMDFEPETPAECFSSVEPQTFQSDHTQEVPADSQPSSSWIGDLLLKLKKQISSPPPAPVEKKFIPYEELRLADLIDIEERKLQLYRDILSTRESFLAQVLGNGLTGSDIEATLDPRLSPALTDMWRQRIPEQEKRVQILRQEYQAMHSARLNREKGPK
jgi:hypothetical protein